MARDPIASLPIDASVIPPAVKAAAAAANAMQEQFIAQMTGQPVPTLTPAPTPTGNQPETPPVSPDPVVVQQEQIPQQPSQQFTQEDDAATWRHRYLTLEGRVNNMQAHYEGQINNLRSQIQQPVTPTTVAPLPTLSDEEWANYQPTQDDIDTYGQPLIDMVNKFAEGHARRMVAQAAQGVAAQVDVASQKADTILEERMVEMLDSKLAPYNLTFDQLNSDPKFISWLGLTDAYSGAIRLQLLRDAWNSRTGSRVLAICNGYLKEVAPQPPAPTPQPAPPIAVPNTGNGVASRHVIPLEAFAAPGRTPNVTAQSPPAPVQKQIITRQMIDGHYRQKAKGLLSAEQIVENERLINEAIAKHEVY